MKRFQKECKAALLGLLLLIGTEANAASITYEMAGRLTLVDSPVDSVHSLGDVISIRLTLDSDVVDTNNNDSVGLFAAAVRGLDVTINGDTVSATETFDLSVSNGTRDSIFLFGNLERTPGFLDSDSAQISMGWSDNTGALLATDGIPDLAALLLSNWGGVIDTGADIGGSVSIDFNVDSIQVVPIPAAFPLFVAALAGLGLMRRRKLKVQLAA